MLKSFLISAAAVLLLTGCAQKQVNVSDTPEAVTETGNPKLKQRWTFSRQYTADGEMKPRGGTSKGAPVVLDTSPNEAYLSINEPGISKFEQDRRAILAMTGTYRTTFDFVETVPLKQGYKLDRPYQSWATEIVEVIEDTGDFISLQHILVMYLIDDEGNKQGPFVSKHWRQDWKYEDTDLLAFSGNNTWEKMTITKDESRGKWTQAVYQVDDSPRYESVGEWAHEGNYSGWTSEETWRPLPRREFSVRDDYGVLEGVNRHIVIPTGWVHEQDNIKLIVDEKGEAVSENPYISKEVGLNRYERITGTEYAPGDGYWEATGEFWGDVRDAWSGYIAENDTIKLKSSVEGKKLYQYLFEYAAQVQESGAYDSEAGSKFAAETIGSFIVLDDEETGSSAY